MLKKFTNFILQILFWFFDDISHEPVHQRSLKIYRRLRSLILFAFALFWILVFASFHKLDSNKLENQCPHKVPIHETN